MFDFNKLDSYKVALDDGFKLNKEFYLENGELADLSMYKAVSEQYILLLYTDRGMILKVTEIDFNVLKNKVADYFLNNN